MKIVIDISEDAYNYIKANGARIPYYKLTDAIKNGAPLERVLNKIKAEIEIYEADCRLQGGTHECENCNDNVFGSIYQIINKYKAESEE